MPDHKKGEVSHLIYGLERINQIIDLCIDREMYKYVEDILQLEKNASQYIIELGNTAGEKSLEEFGFSKFKFPVKEIIKPSDTKTAKLFQSRQLFKSKKPPFALKKEGKDFPLYEHWSDLFWAKRVRSELQKHNKRKWLDRYEDLTLFLENRIPHCNPPKTPEVDFYTTKFNYLMELSAVTIGEASFGYAERARRLLEFLYQEYDDPKRKPYDRWIWWNMGMAYQHVDRSQKAVLEFNRVIEKFPKDFKQFDFALEYLINIVPAYLQRAAINLKLQLGYHALQTLENGIDNDLNNIKKRYPYKLIGDAVKHLRNRIELHRIDALLQLEMLYEVEKRLIKNYRVIFNKARWNPADVALPKGDPPLEAIKTQFVEHTINWWHQKAERISINIRNFQKLPKDPKKSRDHNKEILRGYNHLKKLIEKFEDYWKWIEGNREDERIFYSRWAQIIKLGMETVCKLEKLKNELTELDQLPENASTQLLEVTIKLYLSQSLLEKLPVIRKKRPKPNERLTIELENLRSDDLPDFTSGLSTFYEKMSDIFLRAEEEGFSQDLKRLAEKILKESSIDKPVDYLKEHHENLLDALGEYEIEFGENQQIKSLKRRNERLFWSKDTIKECKGCLKEKKDTDPPEIPEINVDDFQEPNYFVGLLVCHEEPEERKDNFLYCEDYQNIMQKAEKYLINHLHSPSLQKPARKALHFIGLQRWNSLTPAQGRSVGGGYLIYRTDDQGQVDLGIAIDPGFDFVRNLFRMGFSLRDIDIVLISHAHPDHLWDFETMIQLLRELESKEKITHKKITHRLNVIMTLGSYKRLSHIIKNPKLRSFINPLVIDICKEVDPEFFFKIDKMDEQGRFKKYSFRFSQPLKNAKKIQGTSRWQPILPSPVNQDKWEIEIEPTQAYHEDFTDISDSFGFKINFHNKSDSSAMKPILSFGYTGDTKWVGEDLYSKKWGNVACQYDNCNVLLFHIGSLIDHKNMKKFADYPTPDECAKLIRKENHPYLMGTLRFLKSLGHGKKKSGSSDKNKMILIGEFGEELRGGIRTDLVKRLQGEGLNGWPILPVDVGFDVLLYEYPSQEKPSAQNNENSGDGFKFLCALCDEHRHIKDIDYFRFGQDEAIFHICKTCMKSTPDDVRQTKLRKLYEIGRELRTLPDSSQ